MTTILSLLFGSIAILIPIFMISKDINIKCMYFLSIISFSLCGFAIAIQNYYTRYYAEIGDTSTVIDTIGAITRVSMVLITVVVLLNLGAFAKILKKYAKKIFLCILFIFL